MKRKVRKPNGAKKPSKVPRSTGRKVEGEWVFVPKTEHNKRSELWGQWKLSTLATLLSLGLEREDIPPNINRSKREASLTDPAPLPVTDAVGGEHPAFICIGHALLAKRVNDLSVLQESDSRLLARFTARQTELEARVTLAEAALERLVHNEAERLKLVHGGAATPTAGFPPGQEVPTDLPADLPRRRDPASTHEVGHGAPLDQDAGVSQGAVGVPLVKESGNPERKRFPVSLRYIESLGGQRPVAQRSRLSRFVRKCVAQVRRLLDACARRITGFQPPE